MLKLKKVLKIFMLFAIIAVTTIALTGCGKENDTQEESVVEDYKQPFVDYFEGIKNKDLERLKSAFTDFENDENSLTQEDLDSLYETLESTYGENLTIDYIIGEGTLLDEEDLEDLKENLSTSYTDFDSSKLTSAYTVPVTITFKGDGTEEAIEESSEEVSEGTEEVTEETTEEVTEETTEEVTEETTDEVVEEITNDEETEFYSIQYDGNWYII